MSPSVYAKANIPEDGFEPIRLDVHAGSKVGVLARDYVYRDPEGDEHTVPAGTETDTQSVPWIFRSWMKRDLETLHASLPHDAAYQTHETPRLIADLRFYYTLRACGIGRAWSQLYAVMLLMLGWWAYYDFGARLLTWWWSVPAMVLCIVVAFPLFVLFRTAAACCDAVSYIGNLTRS